MKNWKKVTTFLLALSMSASLAIGFAACGGDTPEASSPNPESSVQSPDSSSDSSPTDDSSVSDSASDDSSISDSASDDNSSSDPAGDSSVSDSEPDDDSSSNPTDDSSSEEEWDGISPRVTTKKGYTEEGEYGKVFTYPDLKVAENFEMYSWSEYELVKETSCLTAGIKQVRWEENQDIIHQEYIAPRGHDYTYNNGYCKCGAGPVYPKAPSNIKYVDVQDSKSGISGKGEEYDRYELTEGYFEVTCKLDTIWLSFSIDGPGQYALYTIGSVDKSVEINRYDASAQYIPVKQDGTYINFPATQVKNGLYGTVTCNTVTWSTSWRATFSVDGDYGKVVRFRFVKIDEEAWSPKTVRVQHLAQQINEKHAPAGPENTSPVVVPYETDYFYEESSGYYRMGTPDNPGEIIYAAITKIPPRMLLDKSFTQIQYEAAHNLYLSYSKTIDGDNLVRDYLAFISGDTDNDMVSDISNCYKNYVNVDGLYPVNAELFEFLNLYVQKNCPMEIPEEIKQDKDEFNKRAWLAACYYYKNLKPGSSDLPYEIEDIGEVQISTADSDWTYYSLSYTNSDSLSTITYCTISWDNPNIVIRIKDGSPLTVNSILVETSAAQPFVFSIISNTFEAETFTLNIVETYAGSQDDPETINVTKGTQTVEMNSIEHIMVNGTSTHQKYYNFVVAEDGQLSLSTDVEKVLVSISYTNADGNGITVMLDKWQPLDVKAGDLIEIVVGPADDAIDFDMTITLA